MVEKWLNNLPDPNIFYNDIQALIASTGRTLGITSVGITYPDLNFLMGLANISVTRGREYSKSPTQSVCSGAPEIVTQYNYVSAETMMLMIGLTCLSWLAVNIKNKTEDGHCHNPIHTSSPKMCKFGSSFHKELYDDLISITKEMINRLQDTPPKEIPSTKS